MDIIIVGCGKIGTVLTSTLTSEGHNIAVIDTSDSVIAEITNIYDIIGVCGSGTDYETLDQAGVRHAGLFIAVTDSDETNMLACFLAKRMGAKHTIARIRNPEYNDNNLGFMRQQLELDMSINPEMLTAQDLFNTIRFPAAIKTEYFSGRRFEMVEIRLKEDSPLLGTPLWELRKKFEANFLVCCVQRGEEVFVPDGSFILQAGDRVGISAAPSEVQKLTKTIGLSKKQSRSVMILGASRTTFYLGKMLIASGCDVKIIELSREKCEKYSELLPKADFVCGDGAQQELLLEEGLLSTDCFTAMTGIDEENILLSVFAARKGVPKVITKVSREEFSGLAESLGLESIVSPRHIIAEVLVQYARALENSEGSSVETLYKLMDDKAEALEFTVRSDFAALNAPLKDMKLKKNVLLAGILRGRKAIIPTGDDTLQAGDKAVVLAAGQRLSDLSDILE